MIIDLSVPWVRKTVALAFIHMPKLDNELRDIQRLVEDARVASIQVSRTVQYAILYATEMMLTMINVDDECHDDARRLIEMLAEDLYTQP